jgi:hypothetical protein
MTWLLPWWLAAGCAPGEALVVGLETAVAPSAEVPAAFEVSWEGPEGRATLWAAIDDELSSAERAGKPEEPAWRRLDAAVDEGPSTLPLALFPAGAAVRYRVVVDGPVGEIWSEAALVRVPAAPPSFGGLRASGALDAGGHLVVHRFSDRDHPEVSTAGVLDAAGRLVWWLAPDAGWRTVRALPAASGDAIFAHQDTEVPGADVIERIRVDGGARTRTAVGDSTHDFREHPAGTLVYLAYEERPAGTIPGIDAPVVADAVMTVAEGGSSPEVVWSFFEDYPAEPWRPCDHAEPGEFVPGKAEWTHANSLVRCPEGDGWLVLARQLDVVLHLEDPTAPGERATLTWELGGERSSLATDAPESAFDHGHFSDAWMAPDGLHLLIFDNRAHDPKPIRSRVVEYLVEPEAGRYRLVRVVRDEEPLSNKILGDAQRLPAGQTLVTWTLPHELVAYGAAGAEAWRLSSQQSLGRTTWTPDLHP